MTVQSTGTKTTTMPPSRYKLNVDEISNSNKITTFPRPSLPQSINAKVKSFSEALRSSSPTSSLGENTLTTDNKSNKSAREVQLEAENAILKQERDQLAQQLNQLQESQAQLQRQQAAEKAVTESLVADKATDKARSEQLTTLVQELQQQVQALAAKLPPTPRKSKRHRRNSQQEDDDSNSSGQSSQMNDSEEEQDNMDEIMEPTALALEALSPSTGEGPEP